MDPNPSKPAERDVLPQSVAAMPLRLHVTLGRATLLLKDIFKMTVGSTVDLGKLVTEPAEVVVNGRVLARGQLMVLDGNYALKVVEKV
jgi:flagellar motor switch protein FliN/FliY